MNVTMSRCLIAASIFAFSAPLYAFAQDEEDPSAIDELDRNKPAVAPVYEVPGAAELRDAMRRIASRPMDSYALLDAGNAALLLGDANAALNFYTRANTIQPSNGRIKTGLAVASVRTENPFEALRLFDEAVRLGVSERSIAADRALAFDLMGNFVRAQQDYILARSAGVTDALIVQQAISLSVGGKRSESDAMLSPLLRRNVPAAWRARAFLLAARGDYKESVRVTQGFMPPRSAQELERYLRQMPELTSAQQAAAIHLGHFPANNIGRDSDAIRAVASNYPVQGATGSGRLVPQGQPLGTNGSTKPIKESGKERKARERLEKLAANEAKNTKSASAVQPNAAAVTAPGTGRGLVTDIARSRILEAEKASVRLIAATSMPPPDNARPLVTAVLPPETIKPARVLTPTPSPTPAPQPAIQPAIPPKPAPNVAVVSIPAQQPTPAPTEVKIVSVIRDIPAQPLPTPMPTVPIPAPTASTTTPIVAVVPTTQPVIAQPSVSQAMPAQPIAAPSSPSAPLPVPVPMPVTVPSVIQPDAPPPTITAPASSVIQPATASAPLPAPNQDSVPAIPNLNDVSESKVLYAVVTPSVPEIKLAPEPVSVPLQSPAIKPEGVAAPSFNLDDIVGAITIPESEQQSRIVPVNLKTLKTNMPKLSAAEQSAADKAKALGKSGSKSAVLENPARYWVQIATGSTSAFSGDMRNNIRKYPALFKGQNAWSSPWGKNSRLVVGPFSEARSAKKWETDYNKAGGKGFVWRSDKGIEVNPLRGR